MSEPALTDQLLSQGGSLVDNPSQLQENVKELVMSVFFGRRLSESFASLDPDGSWAKTSRGCSQLTLAGHSEPFLETWPTWGLMSGGVCMEQRMLEHRTEGTGSLSWPTPRATKVGGQSSPGYSPTLEQVVNWPTPRVQTANAPGIHGQGWPDLQTAVMWRTPTSNDARNSTLPLSQIDRDSLPGELLRSWPTPTAFGNNNRKGASETSQDGLATAARMQGMVLNPEWVEVLMGFPTGWTQV